VIRRVLSLLLIAWMVGFGWFALSLPVDSSSARTDGVVVLTGGTGRFKRGLAVLAAGRAQRLLVSGVDPIVRRVEFEQVQGVPAQLSRCCIDLGKNATDTVSNAKEAAAWARHHKFKTIRLVTSDWHMRRARFELERELHGDAEVTSDAVPGEAGLITLIVEYNKYSVRRAVALLQ
jgi:uncharacterized SAM-binding protein YcdF (DUF218 family)